MRPASPATWGRARTAMDVRRDHAFRVPRPDLTPARGRRPQRLQRLSPRARHPLGCAGGASLVPEGHTARPHFAQALHARPRPGPGATERAERSGATSDSRRSCVPLRSRCSPSRPRGEPAAAAEGRRRSRAAGADGGRLGALDAARRRPRARRGDAAVGPRARGACRGGAGLRGRARRLARQRAACRVRPRAGRVLPGAAPERRKARGSRPAGPRPCSARPLRRGPPRLRDGPAHGPRVHAGQPGPRRAAARPGQARRGRSAAARATQADAQSAAAHRALSRLLAERKRAAESLRELQRAAALRPDDPGSRTSTPGHCRRRVARTSPLPCCARPRSARRARACCCWRSPPPAARPAGAARPASGRVCCSSRFPTSAAGRSRAELEGPATTAAPGLRPAVKEGGR